jgi:hypothetical protein
MQGKLMLLNWRRSKRLSLLVVVLLSILFSNPLAAQSELAQRMDFLRNSSSTLEARWERLGSFQKSAAYLKRLTPFLSWINLCTAVDVEEKSFLMGDCLRDEGDSLFRLPMEQTRRVHSAAIERLWAISELDAITYASAVQGEAIDNRLLKNVMSIAQLIAVGILAIVFVKRFNISPFAWMSAIQWTKVKRAFYVSVAIWLLGGAALQIFGRVSGFSIGLMNFQTLVLVIFGGLSLVLGVILFGRWLWTNNAQY